MKRKYVNRIIAVVLTLALALSGLWAINRVLVMKRNDGILTMQNFYAQPEGTVDVLLVGNSHSGINVDTATLWSEYGLSAYNLWGGVQPLWNSYHFIVEALKTQRPQVICLEITATVSDYEYSEEQNQIKNVAGMKLSKNKLEAVKATAPQERWLNLLLGFPLYHGRFNELEQQDFKCFPWSAGLENYKGSYLLYGVGNYQKESAEGVTARREIMDKELDYLMKIIELCKQENIPLMLFKTPTVEREKEQEIFNTVADIADENGLPFVNMNLMDSELGITAQDYSTDRHMNGSGARKVAHWLGAYLAENYALTDHRGDARYNSWEINSHNINNDYLAAITANDDYFAELRRNGRSALIVKNEPWTDNDGFAALADELDSIGLKGIVERGGEKDAYLITDTATGGEAPASINGDTVSFTLDGKELTVNFEYQDIVYSGKRVIWFGASDVVMVVYDNVTHEVADVCVFTSGNRFELQRAETD